MPIEPKRVPMPSNVDGMICVRACISTVYTLDGMDFAINLTSITCTTSSYSMCACIIVVDNDDDESKLYTISKYRVTGTILH